MVTTTILFIALVALIIVLIKFLICNCIMMRRRQALDDTEPIISGRESLWIEYERLRVRRTEPPPDFDEALRSSIPISYIEIDDPPPPSYEDYMTIYSTTFEDNFIDLPLTSMSTQVSNSNGPVKITSTNNTTS